MEDWVVERLGKVVGKNDRKGLPEAAERTAERRQFDAGDSLAANSLTLGFQPEEVISVDFLTKAPGPRLRLRPSSLSFDYSAGDKESRIDAYAKVLLDCMAGDHMLFWRQDGIEESWRFLEPILSRCESCAERIDNLHLYAAGSAGPQRALDMMPSGRGKE